MAKCKEQKPCGCKEASVCGCDIKLDLLCAFYSGVDLQPLGITAGMDGNTVIKIINDYLTELDLDPTIIQSVGDGAEVYKGLSLEARHEIKSLIAGEGIIITEQEDTITLAIDPSIIPTPDNPFVGENVGIGSDVYIDDGSPINKFRRIGSANNSVTVSGSGNNGLNLAVNFPVIDGEALSYTPEDPGINVYKKLEDKKLQFLPLIGENLAINYLYEDNEAVAIRIGNPSAFEFRTFYVNANYPFDDGNGTIGKPYRTFDECYQEYVSPNESNPERPGENYNRAYPKNKGAKIIIQSNITTTVNPSINRMVFEITDESYVFNYSGNDAYVFDTEQIYPFIQKTGTVLTDQIYFQILGNGSIKRTNNTNRGLVRCWGSNITNSPTHTGQSSSVSIGDINSNLKFTEAEPLVDGSFQSMDIYNNGVLTTLEAIYGGVFKASSSNLYLPSIDKSLFNIQYRNPAGSQTIDFDGKVTIESFSQTSIYSKNALIFINGQIYNLGNNNYVAYNGTTNHEAINPSGVTWVRYVPHTGKYQLQLDDNSVIYCKGFFMDQRTGFSHYGWDAAIYSANTTIFGELICRHFSNNYYNSFVKLSPTGNDFALGTGGAGIISEIQAPNAQYLLSGGLSGTGQVINCLTANTTIYSYKDLKPASSLSKIIFNTQGTVLALKGRPVISGIQIFTDATDAETNGIVTGGLFKDASKSNNINSI